jgi:hypothetical protein
VAVHVGGTELVPALASLLRRKDNQAVAYAAYLALDRLTLREPAQILAQLQADPSLLEGREQTRANYFARADVQDPKQRAILEQYLLDSGRSEEELKTFTGLYPNANFMVSQNLLTRSGAPTGTGLVQSDLAALTVLNEWLREPRFSVRYPQLEEIKRHLDRISSPTPPGNHSSTTTR